MTTRLVIFSPNIGHYHDARFRAVAKLGINFTVIAHYANADFSEFLAPERGDYQVRWLFASRSDYNDANRFGRLQLAVDDILSELRPAVIAVSGWASPASLYALLWAKKWRCRVVMQSDSQRRDADRSLVREMVKSRVVRLADAALVAGPAQEDYATELGIPRDRIFKGLYAVDNDHFLLGSRDARKDALRLRARYQLPNNYLLASARFVPKKNLLRAIEGYSQAISACTREVDLVVLGDGPQRSEIKGLIRRLGIEHRVHLLGFQKYSDLPIFYGLADGFVHLSTTEQWGLVVNEAAASELPIIISEACGSSSSLVHHKVNGFIVDAYSVTSIKDAIRSMIDLSPEARLTMGQESLRLVSEWGPNRFAYSLLDACSAAESAVLRQLFYWEQILIARLARTPLELVQ